MMVVTKLIQQLATALFLDPASACRRWRGPDCNLIVIGDGGLQ
jgi:hypothetical protein